MSAHVRCAGTRHAQTDSRRPHATALRGRGTADGRPTVPTPMEVTMFMHNKRLQYTVRVGTTNPGLANLM
ncbi:hypothetical protein F0160_28285, partial [Paraburkholderia sp. JPY303]|nr:hypothetical protein [Paraburkholderia atlantica]